MGTIPCHFTLPPAAAFACIYISPGSVFCSLMLYKHLRLTGWQYIMPGLLFFYPSQELDRIAEANELFDAVLTGAVNQDKKVTTNVAPPTDTSAQEKAKTTTENCKKAGNSLRKLSLYIGNFPWVSTTLSVLMLISCLHVYTGMHNTASHETTWKYIFNM